MSVAERFTARAERVEETSAELFTHAIERPGQAASIYEKRRWHSDLLKKARAYTAAIHTLARNK